MTISAAEMNRALIALDRADVAEHGFYKFVELAWSQAPVNRNTPFVPARHIEQMCLHAEHMIPGSRFCPDVNVPATIQDIVVNIPPGYTKTLIWSVFLNAWIWTFRPEYRFLGASFSDSNVKLAASLTRAIVRSKWYVQRWGQLLDVNKQRSVKDFWTIAGGNRFSTTIGGEGTGRHFHGAFVDDPIKPANEQADKDDLPKQVEKANEWLSNVMASRTVNALTYAKGIIMQRLHEDDPSQRGIDMGWTHLCLPALFEPERACVTVVGGDWRTQQDEILEPVRFPREAENKRAHGMGGWDSYAASAQLQQRPAPPGGLIFKEENFRYFKASDQPLEAMFSMISVDASFKSTAGSADVGITIWGELGGQLYLFDSLAQKMGFPQTLDLLIALSRQYKPDLLFIEDKANGPALIGMLKERLNVFNVLGPDPKTNKESRAQAANVYYQAHVVHHNEEMPNLKQFEHVLKVFPKGKNKDLVDSSTQAILYLASQSDGWRDAAYGAMAEMNAQISAGVAFQGGFDRHFKMGR